ncbi:MULTISPECIES: phosphate ABC transporter permease PstA [Actinokineospora]|uniref:Phosphate transport system permease protein PstA n=1 Tax=Actinokineospora fastidiosa TaxID=1816 RepID=A0A918L9F4_9PSEU|nr:MULTISPECIES: phosphate ABC transporter permease PstA [Actinokineospora]UVS82459.1 Phosphate transport system permease protein PstA [Actinokineospora sp. UTMC 2448]GGS20978.1 phosphate transport system permease protein PstA [Actinokineospora fastidiosa]
MTTATDLDRPAAPPAFQEITPGRRMKNRVAGTLITGTFLLALAPLVWVLLTVVVKGFEHVLTAEWWTHSLAGLTSRQFGGGVYHAIYGTLIQGLICAIIAVPIAILVAVYLVEYGRGSRLARAVTFTVDILSGVPSIVAALFIYALWITTFGLPRSAFAVALALVLLMIPVVVRTTEELLKIVPDELREAAYALGIPKWKTIVKIVIPTAMSGIITGISLAIARVMGETAPVLVLVGYNSFINMDPFEGNMASLPLLMNSERLTINEVGEARVWGAAVTLILIITVFNLLGSLISRMTSLKTK